VLLTKITLAGGGPSTHEAVSQIKKRPAKLIIQFAKDGERDPTRLAKRPIEIVRGSS
jgi:hypothetical protein